jgi:NADH-quinone oxidoreductase subunit N
VVRAWGRGKGEFFTLLLSCTLGMMLMAGANNLLMMYLALEFVSITSYVMAGMLRRNRKSSEASLKYLIYGAAASGLMIYGMTFLYGVTGTLDVPRLAAELAQVYPRPQQTFYLITGVLVLAGFAYKIAAVPFHMWCPDAYEGAPTPVTAFFSVGPKAAGFAMLIRFLLGMFGTEPARYPIEWTLLLALMCVLTMAVGNFSALHQQNLKRLLAYSSIAHAGYMLLAFTVFSPAAVATVMFYLVIYLIMNLGAFLVVIVLEERYGIETVEGCKGIGWRLPFLGVMMGIFLFSLTGLPPTAGFWGKVYIFTEMIKTGEVFPITMCVIAVFFTVV